MDASPWLEKRFDRWEINSIGDSEIVVNISSNQKVEIDKLYGPMAASPIRAYLDHQQDKADWVVEYQCPRTQAWTEKARWDCQENWPDGEDE